MWAPPPRPGRQWRGPAAWPTSEGFCRVPCRRQGKRPRPIATAAQAIDSPLAGRGAVPPARCSARSARRSSPLAFCRVALASFRRFPAGCFRSSPRWPAPLAGPSAQCLWRWASLGWRSRRVGDGTCQSAPGTRRCRAAESASRCAAPPVPAIAAGPTHARRPPAVQRTPASTGQRISWTSATTSAMHGRPRAAIRRVASGNGRRPHRAVPIAPDNRPGRAARAGATPRASTPAVGKDVPVSRRQGVRHQGLAAYVRFRHRAGRTRRCRRCPAGSRRWSLESAPLPRRRRGQRPAVPDAPRGSNRRRRTCPSRPPSLPRHLAGSMPRVRSGQAAAAPS